MKIGALRIKPGAVVMCVGQYAHAQLGVVESQMNRKQTGYDWTVMIRSPLFSDTRFRPFETHELEVLAEEL